MSQTRTDEEWDAFINQAAQKAAQDAVALYDEVNEHRFGLMMESLDAISLQVAKIPKMEKDIAELKSDMKTVKFAVKETNRELHEMNGSW